MIQKSRRDRQTRLSTESLSVFISVRVVSIIHSCVIGHVILFDLLQWKRKKYQYQNVWFTLSLKMCEILKDLSRLRGMKRTVEISMDEGQFLVYLTRINWRWQRYGIQSSWKESYHSTLVVCRFGERKYDTCIMSARLDCKTWYNDTLTMLNWFLMLTTLSSVDENFMVTRDATETVGRSSYSSVMCLQ